ncbi:MAG TPA: hypothetical protein VLH77_00725, partial [Gammaproteobacteria bacterium]|nr:hypothetical protein [Gammaproteobacteria bacterium]
MTRLILGLLFTTFLLILPHSSWISAHVAAILQFILATPVVFWSAWPIWQKGWLSVRNLHLDRFTLMAIGLGLAYGYSFIALIVPEWFFSTLLMNGEVDLHFDWAAIMAVLVSFEQVMEHLAWNKAETILWNAKSSHPSQLKTNDKAAKEQLSTLNIQLSLDAAIPYFVLGVLVLAVLTFVLGLVYAPYPAISWALKSTLSVIMIAGAGMLTLVSPLAVAIGMGRGASTGIMIKNIESLETLARTDMLVIDKSSIIALDQLTVTTVLPVSIMSKDQLLYFAASLELASKHPLARAVVASAQQSQCALVNPTEFCEEKGLGVCGKIDGQFIAVG